MTVAAMFTNRTEGLPELEMGCARISESGVRRPQWSAKRIVEWTAAVASDAARRTSGPSIALRAADQAPRPSPKGRASMSCPGQRDPASAMARAIIRG